MTAKKEKLLQQAYDTYIDLMLGDFPLDRIGEVIVSDVSGYGTTRDEKILEIGRLWKVVNDQREQGAGIDIRFRSTPICRRIGKVEDSAIFVDEFEISMMIDGNKNMIPLRLSSVFEYHEGAWKLVHLHGSKAVETEGDTWHKDELKQKNEELQKLVEQKTLDLEKKNRDLEIEAALERVRTVTMGMQNPDDLMDVCQIISEQLELLKVQNIRNTQVAIIDESKKIYSNYQFFTAYSKRVFEETGYEKNPASRAMVREMQKSANSFFIGSIKNKELREFRAWRKNDDQFPDPLLDKSSALYYYFYSIGKGGLGLTTYQEISGESLDIFKRFHNVFALAYRRFIDIQQAEAQAREAQLELSLERIRAQVTAMSESAELLDIVVTMRTEFVSLGHEAHYFWYMRYLPETYEKAMTSGDGTRIGMVMTLPRHIHGDIKLLADWEKSGEPTVVFPMDVETAVDYVHKMIALGDFKQVDPNAPTLDDIRHIGGLTFVMARTTHGEIGFSLPGPVPDPSRESLDTLVRFAGVFDLAYRRFEDLKTAEQQNRETQIELALERVRAKTMAMQKSEELAEVVTNLFSQLDNLGIRTYRCSLGIIDPVSKQAQLWSTTNEGKVIPIAPHVPLTENVHLKKLYAGWKKQGGPVIDRIAGHERIEWVNYINSYVDFKEYKPGNIDRERILKEPAILHSLFFKQGSFTIHTAEELDVQSLGIIQRFANVFEQTYTRFLDLQKAEAQAREAIKQASLDRIRGHIASMRHADDLQQVTPLIWNELKNLEVPFFRCGIFIVNESKKHVQVYLTTPDGKPLGALDLAFDANQLTKNTVESWRRKEVYQQHWNREEFVEWTKEMMKLRQIKTPEVYQGATEPPESLHLHFIPFAQGMLYVGNTVQLQDEKIALVRSLAEAFSYAYSRYEDFVVLEEAKQKVEKALGDLKATQAQLIHSEKMASLGELTAGIAHEIQNPLNFVNNFSEVSVDLLEEMHEEMVAGNTEEVRSIALDLRQNLEKIRHHGQRASGIVKGMLEHSRSGTGQKEPTDINALADEYLRLAYHGLRAKDKSFNADFSADLDEQMPLVKVIPQDMGRVILNLINNAFYAASAERGKADQGFKPLVVVTTKYLQDKIEIRVKDNGPGIPEKLLDKIFQPFFTTKPTGIGTGLGLSLSYDIITKGHGGDLKVNTKAGQGTEFIITLPAVGN